MGAVVPPLPEGACEVLKNGLKYLSVEAASKDHGQSSPLGRGIFSSTVSSTKHSVPSLGGERHMKTDQIWFDQNEKTWIKCMDY